MVYRHKEYQLEDDIRETPPALFAALDAERHFTIDACALPSNTKCDLFYAPDGLWWRQGPGIASREAPGVDGLTGLYTGQRVWCNPPFSLFDEWLPWAWRNSDAELITMIAPGVRGDRPWWQRWVEPYRDDRPEVLSSPSRPQGPGMGQDTDDFWRLKTHYLEGRIDFLEDGHPIWQKDDSGEIMRYKRDSKTHKAGDPKEATAMFGIVLLEWTHE